MKVFASTKDMSREEWLEARRHGIGGSDAAAILGLSPWTTPLEVYLDKIGELEEKEQTDAMYFGTLLEDTIAEEFTRRTGINSRPSYAIWQHDDYPFMLANFDRRLDGGGILEVKNIGIHSFHTSWYDGVPEYYVTQVQHYMAITGDPFAYFAVLVGGQRFEHYLVERDPDFIAVLIDFEKRFWEDFVLKRRPPEIDGSEAANGLLRRQYPEAIPSTIDLPETALNLIAAYDMARELEKIAKQDKDKIGNELKIMLGEHEQGLAGDRVVSWGNVTANRFDSKGFREDHPDLYEQYIKPSNYRRFGIK